MKFLKSFQQEYKVFFMFRKKEQLKKKLQPFNPGASPSSNLVLWVNQWLNYMPKLSLEI